MFFYHEVTGPIEFWFTDRSLDLRRHHDKRIEGSLAAATRVDAVATMNQVHGPDVVWVSGDAVRPDADAMLTDAASLGLLVRVADCLPIVLAAPDDGLVGVVHCGRAGLVAGVVPAAVESLRERGAGRLQAWLGPRVCGRCYELPADMADEVADAVPAARCTTSWGSPAADIGAGAAAQLVAGGAQVRDIGSDVCTIADQRFFSHRRDGSDAGRFGAVAVLRDKP